MRGVAFIVAVTVVAEVGDFPRFDPRQLMAFLGLVPSEYSSVQPSDAAASPRLATLWPSGL
jgi:transposase